MNLNFELLKRIAEAPGIPGYEDAVRAIVIEQMRPLVDELRVDALGNVIGTRHGNGPRVMLAAHMDEIGFMVKSIDDYGGLRLQPVGGFDARNLAAQRVFVHTRSGNALRGALHARRESHPPAHLGDVKPDRLEDLFVDVGLTPDETKAQIEIGNMVTFDRTTERVGNTVMSKSLDDRVSVFIMLEVLRALGTHEVEIAAVATVQEEVGLRGAHTGAFGVNPDIGIAIDICPAGMPGGDPAEQVTRLGGGPAIKLMDRSVITNHRLVRHFRDVAERAGIAYQLEILPFGGTDAGAIHQTHAGVASITISIPTRYAHTVNEMASMDDIAATIDLMTQYLAEAHQGDYRLG